MSTVATQNPASLPVISHENLLFDYPEADIILRSRDSYEFRVPKLFIVQSSPILEEKLTVYTTSAESDVDLEHAANAFHIPVVQLPIDGAILFSLLTYIFPVSPVLPSTVEQVMELLSVAQMYKVDAVLPHIRNHIAQQEPSFIREETAFLIYSLSQKHGLHSEALQAARCTLGFATLTIDSLAKENRLDVMPGAFLHNLWKYHQRVRSNLTMDLRGFKKSIMNSAGPLGHFTIQKILACFSLTDSGLPRWLDDYISNIGADDAPVSINPTGFYRKLVLHAQRSGPSGCRGCGEMPQEDMCALWGALTAVVDKSIVKSELDFAFPIEGTRSEGQARQTHETSFLRKYSNMPNADVILQSSDLIDFYVHRSVLIASSPFFRDMFSLPQPPNSTVPNALPVLRLSEDAETLDSLISMLYPVPPEIPPSSDNVLALLAAAAKYVMDAVKSSIRTEINRRGLLPSTSPELFRVYAVACSKGLTPEMESLARLTLAHPLTFKSLGDALRSFEGWALRDLADFRIRSLRNFTSKSKSFFKSLEGPSKIWADCFTVTHYSGGKRHPYWLVEYCPWFRLPESGLSAEEDSLTNTIPTDAQLCDKYLKALQRHAMESDCSSCLRVHALKGDKYCEKLREVLAQVREVRFDVGGMTWDWEI